MTDNPQKDKLQVGKDHRKIVQATEGGLRAIYFDSSFSLSHDTYNGIYAASNGLIYYVLCSESVDVGGKMYSFDPENKEIKFCGDLTEACGEKDKKAIPQGKSHVNFVELDGKLYFGTHIGYYTMIEGRDRMGVPPEGYKPYPGGHILSYDMETGEFRDLAIVPEKEGLLTMNMDIKRKLIYGITWPTGHFFKYDLHKNEMKDFGRVSEDGEDGVGEKYRTLCRSIAIDPESGMVYYSTSDGIIFQFNPENEELTAIEEDNLRKDYFGQYDPASPGHMGYNWRQIFYYDPHEIFYGVHGNSGYLFSFDPVKKKIEIVERITSQRSKQSGMFDQFSYGYLGFALGHDQRTVYYLTGSPIFENGKIVAGKSSTAKGEAKGLEKLHLITYDLLAGKYCDRGGIYFDDGSFPLYVNSIAIGHDGNIYFLGRVPTENRDSVKTDLICIRNPVESLAE